MIRRHRRTAGALPTALAASVVATVAASVAAALAVSVGAAPLLHAQAAATRVIRRNTFTDMNSVRVESVWRGVASAAGSTVRAQIVNSGDAGVVWSGTLGTLNVRGSDAVVKGRIAALKVVRWSPSTPTLYRLVLDATVAGQLVSDTTRIGFRTIASANGRILLNGRALFLRGNAINPPGRNIPDSLSENPRFARDYLRYLKSIGVNIIRLGSISSVWMDAADDVGMLIFQGSYGVPKGGTATRPPTDNGASLTWYRNDVLGSQVNHPSVVIYTLANEVADAEIHYESTGAAAMGRFLQTMYDSLHVWDPTRLIIANAGCGFDRTGEICDLHRYWGWYYNSFLSYYTLRDPNVCWRGRTGQPITLSENTGNYTAGDGRFNLVSNTKQPDSQLNWTGHAPDDEQGPRALAYQAWMAGQAIEITRRLRERNANLAGLSPFTIAFSQWYGITSFADMRPKPVLAQYARSFQPVLLSWELWTQHVYAGDTVTPVAHVVNDADDGRALQGARVHFTLRRPDGVAMFERSLPVANVPYYGASSIPITFVVPSVATPGVYTIAGAIVRGRDTVSRNSITVRVYAKRVVTAPAAPHDAKPDIQADTTARRLFLYDGTGRTRTALNTLGTATTPVSRIVTLDVLRDALIVGSGAWDATLSGQVGTLETFVSRGSRVLLLDQRADQFTSHWLPGGVKLAIGALDHWDMFPDGRPWAQGMSVNPERPTHPVFAEITRDDLFLWSDYTGWREHSPGILAVYPVTHGFSLTRTQELGRVAILANYDHGLTGVALAEFFAGTGSSVLSGFDLVPRIGRDPIADRLLGNLVRYTVSRGAHDTQPLITSKITWGDYASERGLLTGVYSGFLLNTVPTMPDALQAKYPTRIDANGFWVAADAGGWNTRPAIQYVARGRRPFGPYEFTSGGGYKLPDEREPFGEGRVWMRVPAGRSSMVNTLLNPLTEPLDVDVVVNGATTHRRIAVGETASIESAVPAGATTLSLVVRGDRRLFLLSSDVR